MPVPLLIRFSAGACAGLSLLGIGSVVYLNTAAPGCWHELSLGPLLMVSSHLAFAICGLCTAVGLLLRKRWARISMLVIAAAWILQSIASILALAMSHSAALAFITPVAVVVIGLSWMALFNGPQAKQFFTGNRT